MTNTFVQFLDEDITDSLFLTNVFASELLQQPFLRVLVQSLVRWLCEICNLYLSIDNVLLVVHIFSRKFTASVKVLNLIPLLTESDRVLAFVLKSILVYSTDEAEFII